MSDQDFTTTEDQQALATLDIHYGMELGCTPADPRCLGWTVLQARPEGDPMRLLFGRRLLAQFVSPNPQSDAGGEHGGVAVVAPELRSQVTDFLHTHPAAWLFSPGGLAALDALVHSSAPQPITALDVANARLSYVRSTTFRPYVGQWLEWIEPLDEAREMDPVALSLLARFSGGVYAVRERGTILGYAGLRSQSPHVWMISTHVLSEGEDRDVLACALVSRATRAVLAEQRLPLFPYPNDDEVSAQVAERLGYRQYGQAVTYADVT
ncbi:MAG TPA: hypothetical protein VGP82_10850 [Ktedonobacterales bacterium]|nr:hypothetical protein [Ktedonobacterales bacterium]